MKSSHVSVNQTKVSNNFIDILYDNFPSLIILPKVERLIDKEDPTLGELVTLCQSNDTLFKKLTHSTGGESKNISEFAKSILLSKGMNYLLGTCIRTMNQEIFSLPLNLIEGETELSIRRRSIVLARYLKEMSKNTSLHPDHAYLCGLFYNFRMVCFEYLVKEGLILSENFEQNEKSCLLQMSESFRGLGFHTSIWKFFSDCTLPITASDSPVLHALVQIGNRLLLESQITGVNTFRKTSFLNDELIQITGLSLKEIVEPLKLVDKDFKGGLNRQ